VTDAKVQAKAEDLLKVFQKCIKEEPDFEGCECELKENYVIIKRKNHFRAQIHIRLYHWNNSISKELSFYKITKFGGYELERTTLPNSEIPNKLIPQALKPIIAETPVITKFEERPKKVKNIPHEPYNFSEIGEPITRSEKGLRFCQPNYVASGTITIVGLKEGGKIDSSKEGLADPNSGSEMWFYINFITMTQRYGQLLFDGVDKFYPVQGCFEKNNLRITKKFASPYIETKELNTADRDNFCMMAQALKEDFDASNQKTG